MDRWQYRTVSVDNGATGQKAMSLFGRNGWELVAAESFGGWMMFKRHVPEGREPAGPWAEAWTSENVEAAYAEVAR